MNVQNYFASEKYFFVPSARQITVFDDKQRLDDGTAPVGVFTQIESTTTDYTLDLHGRKLGLDLDLPHKDTTDTDDIETEWLDTIRDNIARYMEDGVITNRVKVGDITVESVGRHVWLLTRGNEYVRIDNSGLLPEEDSMAWVATVHGCKTCTHELPDFEFSSIMDINMVVPDDSTLDAHLVPFIEAMLDEERQRSVADMSERRMDSLSSLFGGDDLNLGRMMESVLGGMRRRRIAANLTHKTRATVRIGKGEYVAPQSATEIGRVLIEGEPVLVLFRDHADIVGGLVNSDDDAIKTVDLDGRMLKALSKIFGKVSNIDRAEMTPERFNAEYMALVAHDAMKDQYTHIDVTYQILYTMFQHTAMAANDNWWVRVLANAWFAHAGYPEDQVQGMVVRQVKEIVTHLELEDDVVRDVPARLAAIVSGWYQTA